MSAGVLAASVTLSAAAGVASAARRPAASVSSAAPCAGTSAGTAPATWDHVTLIMFENKPIKKIIGNTTDAPYINSLAHECSYGKNYLSLSPTSLANYVALTSGYTGCDAADANGVCTHENPITANRDPSVWPQAQNSLFELMGSDAVEWAEDSQGNCYTGGAGLFTVTHTAYPYYTRIKNTLCPQNARPFPSTNSDILSARFNMVIPNKKDIMHLIPNTTIAQRIQNGDKWLAGYLPSVLDSPTYQAGKSAIIITWDEGNAKTFTVAFIVITPYTTVGGVSSTAYDHFSALKGIEQMLNVTPLLGHAGDAGKSSVRDDPVFRLK
jgi:hypothetical protein